MKIDHIIERWERFLCIHGDLCGYGKLEKEHDINLMKVGSNNGLIYNTRKSQIKYLQVTFLAPF